MVDTATFTAWDQKTQVAALEQLGRDALRQFGIKPVKVSPLDHGENTTFCVEAAEGKFNLRISRPGYMSTSNIWSEINLLAALRDGGFRVPNPWQDRLVTAAHPNVPEPRDCVLLGWLEGEMHKGDPPMSVSEARSLGRLMARLHDFFRTWPIPPDFDRHELHGWASDRVTPRAFDAPSDGFPEELRLYFRDQEEQDRELLLSLPRAPDTYGLIHADLHVGNVLFLPDEINLIDFDDCGWGFYMYEFAAALAYETRRDDYPQVRYALFDGYASAGHLPPDCERLLVPFLRLRLCGVMQWMLSRTDNPELRGYAPTFGARMAARMQTWAD